MGGIKKAFRRLLGKDPKQKKPGGVLAGSHPLTGIKIGDKGSNTGGGGARPGGPRGGPRTPLGPGDRRL